MPQSKLRPAHCRHKSHLSPLRGVINWPQALQQASNCQSHAGTLPGAAEPAADRTWEYPSGPQHRQAAARRAPVQQAPRAAHRTAAAPRLGRMHQLPAAGQPPAAAAPVSGAAAEGGAHAWQQAAPQAPHAPPRQQQNLLKGGAESEAQDQQQATPPLAAAPQLRLLPGNQAEVAAAVAAGNSSPKVHLDGFGSQNEESPSQGSQDSRSECC